MSDPYQPRPDDLKIAPKAKGPVGEGELEVQPGDAGENLAYRAGLLIKTLWDAPANQAVKDARKNASTLLPGDGLTAPPLRQREEDCAHEKTHRFRRKESAAILEIKFLDEIGQPRANQKYVLHLGHRPPLKGETSAGKLKVKVPPDVGAAVLEFPDAREKHALLIRHLGPLEEPVGIQGRLRNLGFYVGALDGRLGPLSQAAIVRFQIAQKLKPTGEADAPTLAKLKTAYGM